MDGAVDGKESIKRSRVAGLMAPITSRSRSRSRHSTVTDKGQMGASSDALTKEASHIAPLVPGMAEATVIAPERKASPLPSLLNDADSAGRTAPGIVVSANPDSPPTVIPATDGSTARPTKGGIAYPFSLKVGGSDGRNASTLTLESMNITTPPALEELQQEKGLGCFSTAQTDEDRAVKERPVVERFFTAAPSAELSDDSQARNASGDIGRNQRPPVERFETAQEDLNTLNDTAEKA